MTQLENLKNQIKELEKSCDEARDRIKNENLPFLNIYENRAAFFINKIEIRNVTNQGIRVCSVNIPQQFIYFVHYAALQSMFDIRSSKR